MAAPKAKTPAAASSEQNDNLIVVNVGKKYKRKHIRRLRKGRGKIMDRVEELVAGLREEQALAPGAQPLIIVVRQKKKKNYFKF